MFDLHSLGWHSFQQLCLSLARNVFGQTVESFLDTSDAGQDGAFTGVWLASNGERLEGRFVFQVKFTSKRDTTISLILLKDELAKASRLVRNNRCSVYILLTNAGLAGSANEKLESAFAEVGVKHFLAYGYTWICDQLRERKQLRMMVPRLYGLGDLTQILDERCYRQAQVLLESMREDLAKVVLTEAYQKAAEALQKHGFVLLVGQAAAGKTTIASLLSIGALDHWGASTMKFARASSVVDHWNPDEPTQFFWIDDAFGIMQYESLLAAEWNHSVPHLNTMIKKGAKLVLTSRDYIYRRARLGLKQGAFPLLEESQVVINVQDMGLDERRQILYNHMKLGNQSHAFRRKIKPFLESIAINPNFVPEVARRLGNSVFTKGLSVSKTGLLNYVNEQKDFMRELLEGLDDHSKASLALIFMHNNVLGSPVQLGASERTAVERMNSDVGSCLKALEAMKGSLVQFTQAEAGSYWTFKHPTVGDAFSSLLLDFPEMLGIYLQGISVIDLMGQVTCGDVHLKGAVIVTANLFLPVLERIVQFYTGSENFQYRAVLYNFLSQRCSRGFLALAIDQIYFLAKEISEPGLMLAASGEVHLAIKLSRLNLLPEKSRSEFVDTVGSYAVSGYDMAVLRWNELRAVFTDTELESLHCRLLQELIPSLDEIRIDRQCERESDVDPGEHIQPFLDDLRGLSIEYANDETVTRIVNSQITRVQQWIEEELSDDQGSEDHRSFSQLIDSGHSQNVAADQARSIFDDVDS